MFLSSKKQLEKIIRKFTKAVILQIDNKGNIEKVILNTEEDISFRNIKNVYQIFSESEKTRLEQLIQYPSTSTQYLGLYQEYQGKKYISVQIATENTKKYISLTIPNIKEDEIFRKKELEELKDISQTDQLTKVLNRHGLFNKASKLIVRGDPYERIGVAFIDIDNLKQINDKYGHNAGDEVILSIANAIKYNTRNRDIIARIGGDEFVLLVEEISGRTSTIYGLANKLMKKIQKLESKYPTTVSIGVHVFRTKKLKPCIKKEGDFEKCFFEELKYADQAVYESKRLGKNQISVSTNFKRYYKTLSKASV